MDTDTNRSTKESLEDILVRTGMMTAEQMQNVLQTASKEGKAVEQILIENKLLNPRDLVRAISIQ